MPPVPDPIIIDSFFEPSFDAPEGGSWQRELARAIRSAEELLRRLELILPSESLETAVNRLGVSKQNADHLRQFPVLVPENFLDRMRPGDAADPLLRQVLPLTAESEVVEGFVSDAVGDLAARRADGVIQKYQGRVLLIAASACAVHCRYCFRRDYPYEAEPRRLDDWQPALSEIAADTSITEVIFSGGDPWMLSDQRLQALCSAIDAFPHIERIRFHTRLPIVLPARITNHLLSLLTGLRSQVVVVVHANHANEITGDCQAALKTLVRAGVPLLNQSVLLAGVNDSVDALEALSRRLVNVGVMPYYLHQLDQVSGIAHFQVSKARGLELLAELATRLPGYAVPRYVQEIPGQPGKTPVTIASIP